MMLIILIVGTTLVSLAAAAHVRTVYRRHQRERLRSGLTGAAVAELILRRAGIGDVEIAHAEGLLGDHYDPLHKRLVLSTENYFGATPGAVGVAAHEAGHALQHARAYRPLQWRMAAVGVTTYANQVVLWLPLLGAVTGFLQPMVAAWILALAWGVIMLFNLVTLPVEFDASRRAVRLLNHLGVVAPGAEADAVRRVLRAAAWTYVAAFVTSLAYLLWHLLPLLGGRSRD